MAFACSLTYNNFHHQMVQEGTHNSNHSLSLKEREKIIPQNFDHEVEDVLAAEEHDEELLVRSEYDRAAQAAGKIMKGRHCCH